MSTITFKSKGDFSKTTRFLKGISTAKYLLKLASYGQRGVEALRSATPVDTGLTANSWTYKIINEENGVSIVWYNTNVNKGVNIALVLDFGHGTPGGHYVRGKRFISKTIRPIFDEIEKEVWEEVTKS